MSEPTVEEMVDRLEYLITWCANGESEEDGCGACPDYENCTKEIEAIRKRLTENQIMRELLWANHGCPQSAMYGDDGKMDCNACLTDFKTVNMKEFQEKLQSENIKKYQAYLKQTGGE